MKIHTIKGYIQTTYIIEYPDKILILDSGCRPDYKKILEFVTIQLARGIKDIKLVALSHAHPDHMGGADLLQTKFQIPIAATRETMQWYRGIKGTITYLIDVLLTYYVSYRLKKSIFVNLFFNPYFKLNFDLNEENFLPFFPDWQVLKTPGHTPNDICFYHYQTGTLYIADMIIKKRGEFILPYPIYLPYHLEN